MIKSKLSSFLLIFILIVISKAQDIDKDVLRAVACLSMIRKMTEKPNDPQLISSYMLTCFITIDDSTAQKLIASQNSNKLDLDEKQIKKLTDFYEVQNRYDENQIMDYSKDLNSALEKLKNFGAGAMNNQGGSMSDKNSKNNKRQGKGLLSIIITSLIGMFNANDSLIGLFILFFIIYLILRQLRKWFGSGNNKSNNVSNKNKNNNKKKIQ